MMALYTFSIPMDYTIIHCLFLLFIKHFYSLRDSRYYLLTYLLHGAESF